MKVKPIRFIAALVTLFAAAAPSFAQAPANRDAAQPGTIVPEPSTPTALAVRWPVVGDQNLNARIAVAYRPVGTEAWREAYPLFRTFNDRVSPENSVAGGHLFAGSIVDLTPSTEYEVRLTLDDPDGGGTVRTLRLRTAPIPTQPPSMQTRYVVPLAAGQKPGGTGTSADPFRGLRTAQAHARPGDLFLLAPGVYAAGAIAMANSGTPDRPTIYRGPADGSAILDGQGGAVLVDVSRRADIWFDRLTFRNAGSLLRADGASRIVAKRNRFLLRDLGFTARGAIYKESVGFYIVDNEFVGTTQWPRAHGIEQVYGVNITGAGHVVAYNHFRNVGDAVHNGDEGRMSASDIHNNDIETCTDDGIETDYSDTNVRVFRNRITNCFSGISAQPVHGGPVYVFRNLLFNLQYSPFKLHNDTAGVLIFHNTSVASGIPFHIQPGHDTVRDIVTRNNIFAGRAKPALRSSGQMARCDFDNDGYDWPGGEFALWNGKTYASPMAARGVAGLYSGRGAVILGPQRTFAGAFGAPTGYERAFPRTANEPLLGPASRAIDRGVRLPNFNDDYAGKAPDLGCCEAGVPLPQFGPRPEELKQ